MKFKASFALLGAALTGTALGTALVGTAHADVKYTETMTMSGKSATGGPPMRTTTYLKAGLERTEQTMNMGPVSMKMISVSSCPTKRSMRFDPELKLYTSSPLFGENKKADEAKAADSKPAARSDKKTGKMTMTAEVRKLGIEEIAGRKARHYIIDQKITPEGCAGNKPTNFRMEIWVADYDMPAFACRNPWMSGGAGAPRADGGCSLSFEFKGDQAAMAEAYKGLIVKRKMVMGDTVMTFQLTELSEAKLDDALFTPGADWKLVADEAFDKERQSAMMRGMMSGRGNTMNDDGGTTPKPAPGGGAGTMGEVRETNDTPRNDDAGKAREGDGAEGGNIAEDVAKETTKKKVKKKFKLPF